jgi:hypothetical protein
MALESMLISVIPCSVIQLAYSILCNITSLKIQLSLICVMEIKWCNIYTVSIMCHMWWEVYKIQWNYSTIYVQKCFYTHYPRTHCISKYSCLMPFITYSPIYSWLKYLSVTANKILKFTNSCCKSYFKPQPYAVRCVCTNTYYPILGGNKIKHYISKMEDDIKLYANSFSVVTLPVFYPLGLGNLQGACTGIRQQSSIPFCFRWRDVFH